MRSLLEAEGFRVDCAANGQEALERLHQGEPPCVILTDLKMPVMDGQRLCQELRQDPALAPIPIIVISGEADLPQIAARLDVAGYCWKPFLFTWLMERVRRVCA